MNIENNLSRSVCKAINFMTKNYHFKNDYHEDSATFIIFTESTSDYEVYGKIAESTLKNLTFKNRCLTRREQDGSDSKKRIVFEATGEEAVRRFAELSGCFFDDLQSFRNVKMVKKFVLKGDKNCFGIIDRDFVGFVSNSPDGRLIVTDACDLESNLLLDNPFILERFYGGLPTHNQLINAYISAYNHGVIRSSQSILEKEMNTNMVEDIFLRIRDDSYLENEDLYKSGIFDSAKGAYDILNSYPSYKINSAKEKLNWHCYENKYDHSSKLINDHINKSTLDEDKQKIFLKINGHNFAWFLKKQMPGAFDRYDNKNFIETAIHNKWQMSDDFKKTELYKSLARVIKKVFLD